jgi:gliding motility-associated-like protein
LVGISGDSTYCPNLGVYLKAYGAWDYTWNTGSKADSIEIKAPGGIFWLLGRSSTGCVSDTIYRRITEEPDWLFTLKGDTSFCTGGNSFLEASGAIKYLWNTGDTVSHITATTPGSYTIVGTNKRGCEKSSTLTIVEFPLPLIDYTLSVHTLDRRHNQLSCNIPPQPDVTYVWKMGDESTETGAAIQHSYAITNSTLEYIISLKATDKNGCVNRATETIDVVPFVPNVFSPNGDGTNDVFMADIKLEVYDRNGMLLYHGTDGWDGRYNGHFVDPDTYYYMIYYPDRNQKIHTKKGYITLVK